MWARCRFLYPLPKVARAAIRHIPEFWSNDLTASTVFCKSKRTTRGWPGAAVLKSAVNIVSARTPSRGTSAARSLVSYSTTSISFGLPLA
jgi:hypothetical protein